MSRIVVLMLSGMVVLNGCTTVATYQATRTLCSKDNIHCGDTPEKEQRYPEQAARKAFEADRAIASAVVESLTKEPSSPPHLAPTGEICAEGLQRICSAASGCVCEPE